MEPVPSLIAVALVVVARQCLVADSSVASSLLKLIPWFQ